MYNPDDYSGVEILDDVFSGALPHIRGPVSLIDSVGEMVIIQDDGDHFLTGDKIEEPEVEVVVFLEYAINRMYKEWEQLCKQKK